jgi:hypothetical protein
VGCTWLPASQECSQVGRAHPLYASIGLALPCITAKCRGQHRNYDAMVMTLSHQKRVNYIWLPVHEGRERDNLSKKGYHQKCVAGLESETCHSKSHPRHAT